MKIMRYIGIALMAALMSVGLPSPAKLNAQPGVSVSFQVFFNSLSPFGRWSTHPQYGSIWIPSVNRDFHPYSTNGRWVMTEYGNTWVSDFDWGWAPFHYGRWFYDDYSGWAWVPDYTWGPGWVNWRTGGGYYGWAPLMPGLDVRVAINLPFNFWIFVPQRHFMSNRWHRYSVPRARVTHIYNQTTIINNYYHHNNHEYAYGPRSSDIRVHTRSEVPVYSYSNRGNNGSYRETVSRSNTSASRTAVTARERSFEPGPTVASPGSGRSSSAARTSTPATPRSENPVATPSRRGSVRERNEPTGQTGNYSNERARSARESAPTREGSAERSNNSAVPRREPIVSPNNGRSAREATPNSTNRATTAPSSRSAPERSTAPTNRSSARESVSPSISSSRESTSPARSTSPTRSTPSSSGGSGRSSAGERGGRP
jgi:hypothetical protein